MKINILKYQWLFFTFLLYLNRVEAQNPIIRNQYTADPTARVFGDSVYLYPSHDIAGIEGKGRKNWFCMEDYHVFSSANLTDWKDHGIIVSQQTVPWANSNAYSMWAPDCISKNGKYYFYFPAWPNDTSGGKRFCVGVAVSDKPYGSFIPEKEPISKVGGIDPGLFIDKDACLPDRQGQAYIYWAMRKMYVAKLKDNMLELATDPQEIKDLPEKGLKEGPFLFERNGIYYFTYPHVENKIERLEYAISNNPMGPFRFAGVIMDESPMGCWTNHQSIIQFKGQWYLFYHENDYSPHLDKNRSVRVDSLFFNEDGTIRKVIPTHRGVGITKASDKIEIDRYSLISDTTVSISFIDTLKKFEGWKAILNQPNSWIQYNTVDFGKETIKSAQIRAFSKKGGTIQIRLDKVDGPLVAEVKIPISPDWTVIDSKLIISPAGIHNLVLMNAGNPVEIDWISFK